MKSNYRISAKAIKDIENIWSYTFETWSLEQADRYYNLLINEFEYIAEHFEQGKSMEPVKQNYRATKVKSHLVFYRKGPDGVTEIIRILHERMDIENRLEE